jgi:hypothetical protein
MNISQKPSIRRTTLVRRSNKYVPRILKFLTFWHKSADSHQRREVAWELMKGLDGKSMDPELADTAHNVMLALLTKLDVNGNADDKELALAAWAVCQQEHVYKAKHRGQYRDRTKGRNRIADGHVQSMGELNDSSPELIANATWSADPVQQMEIEEAIAERIPQLSVAKQSMVKKWIRGDRYAGECTHKRRLLDFLEHYDENAITPETQAVARELLAETSVSDAAGNAFEALLAKCNFISELNFAPLERTFHQRINQEST